MSSDKPSFKIEYNGLGIGLDTPPGESLVSDEIDVDCEVRGARFFKKIGNKAIGLTDKVYDRMFYASVAFNNNPMDSLKRSAEVGIVAVGMSPIDEAVRYGVFGTTHVLTDGNPLLSGAAFGLTTVATQGAVAIATASLLETNTSKKFISKLNQRLKPKNGNPQESLNTEMSPISQGAIAMIGGTAPLLAMKQRKDPSRTKLQNQKFGLKTAGLMGAYFTAEEAGVSKLADMYGWPKTIAGMALALVATQRVYTSIMENKNVATSKDNDVEPTEEVMAEKTTYELFHDSYDQALRVGLFGEDIERALRDPRTISMRTFDNDGKATSTPVLVPIDILEWFNKDLMIRTYGSESEVMVYAHPPFGEPDIDSEVKRLLQEQIVAGKVVLTELYGDDETSPMAAVLKEGESDLEINAFGGELESSADYFALKIKINDSPEVKQSANLYDVHKECMEAGIVTYDTNNGSSLAKTIVGEEADRIWDIYQKPFEGLGEDDPTLAGFDRDSLMDILQDAEIPKVVHRVDGEITTMMLFLHDFSKVPWFNPNSYARDFSEYYETNNILIFPGIVTDEKRRGNNYASEMIDFVTRLYAYRGSSVLLTFECTEVSATYIPELVAAGIENTGLAKVSGADAPIGSTKYFGISQKSIA